MELMKLINKIFLIVNFVFLSVYSQQKMPPPIEKCEQEPIVYIGEEQPVKEF